MPFCPIAEESTILSIVMVPASLPRDLLWCWQIRLHPQAPSFQQPLTRATTAVKLHIFSITGFLASSQLV